MSSSSNYSNELPFGIDPVWFHPVGLIAQNLIMVLLVGFTPASTLLRPILLPVIIGIAWLGLFDSNKIIAALSWTFVLQYIDLCLLGKWNYESEGPITGGAKDRTVVEEKQQPQSPGTRRELKITSSFAKRFRFGWDSAFGYRHIGTPQESKNTQHFDEKNPKYVPTKTMFYINQIVVIIRSYLIIDLLRSLGQNRNSWDEVEIFSRFHEVTKEELIWRFVRVACFWISVQSLWKGMYALISLVPVSIGISKPQFWRPLFASPFEAYTIRRFWGNTWHQILRRVLGNSATFICHDILDIKEELLARYIKLYLVFLISGLLHAAMDVAAGIPFNQQGSVRFLMMQAIGITAEDVVQSLYRRVRGSRDKYSPPPLWVRILGNLWTLVFLVWTTPAWFYPEARRREMRPIRFSVFKLVKSCLMES